MKRLALPFVPLADERYAESAPIDRAVDGVDTIGNVNLATADCFVPDTANDGDAPEYRREE